MKKKILILACLIFLISLFLILWWLQAIKSPDPTNNKQVVFTVKRGETARSIAEQLKKQGLIRSPVAFFLLNRFGGVADSIQAGDFRLSASMDLFTLANSLTHGTMDVQITIPEGWRNEEIALKIAQKFAIPETEFLKNAREGYMFPDTYLIPKDATAGAVVKIFTANFNRKIAGLNMEEAKKNNLSLDRIITIASLVEREAKYDVDRPLVASVILNRLKIGMKLDIDATVQYALGYQPEEKSWWKKELTIEDLAIESPYNTYNNPGLPPASICNPGLSVIKAVIQAPETDYLYYISDKEGNNHYAKTIEEHNANIAKFLNK